MDEQSIFLAALEKTNPAERKAYLDEACAGNAALRRRIEALLQQAEDAGSFLEHPAIDLDRTAVLPSTPPDESSASQTASGTAVFDRFEDGLLDCLSPSNKPGCLGMIGQYEIKSILGRGGMGIVFKAHDTRLERTVAIKLLSPALAANGVAKQRFLREARAAAAVVHPHVVTIHAVDEDRVPYLVMEMVGGMTLRQKLETVGMLEVKEILRIGSQIAQGLAAAHKQGLIHRDVKPANILMENGVERVKITDFGLARTVSDLSVTRSGEVTGTPQYMSPEQALGESVDHRSDLFSLGSVLYAMSTGRPPFRGDTAIAVIRRVIDDTPRPIRELNDEVPEWLCEIIDKLLQKKPDDRYRTAGEVATLLEQHLSQLQHPTWTPVVTAPSPTPKKESTGPAIQKAVSDDAGARPQFQRRGAWHKVMLGVGGIAVVVALAAIVTRRANNDGTTVAGKIPQQLSVDSASSKDVVSTPKAELAELQRAVAAAADTQSVAEQAGLRARLVAFNHQRLGTGEQIAAAGLMSRLLWPADLLKRESIPPEELAYTANQPDQPPPEELVAVFGTGRLKHWASVGAIAFSPDSSKLATPGFDRVIRVWDSKTGQPLARLQCDQEYYNAAGFTADGTALIALGNTGIRSWDAATWDVRSAIQLERIEFEERWDRAWVMFSPDSRLLVAAGRANSVLVYESESGKLRHRLHGHARRVDCIAFSDDGQFFASGDAGGTAIVWDAATGELRKRVECELGPVESVALNADGTLLATGFAVGRISFTNLHVGDAPRTIRIDHSPFNNRMVGSLAFSPDGQRLLAGSRNSAMGLREIMVATGRTRHFLLGPEFPWCMFPRYSPDGAAIACGTLEGDVGLWDAATGTSRSASPNKGGQRSVAVSLDGLLLVAGSQLKDATVWDLRSGDPVRELRCSAPPVSLRFTNEQNRLFGALAGGGESSRTAAFWDVSSDIPTQSFNVGGGIWSVAFPVTASDGTFVVSADNTHAVRVWEFGGSQRLVFRNHTAEIKALAISSDGRLGASAGNDSRVRIWDAHSGDERLELIAASGYGTSLAFSPDAKTLSSGMSDGKIRIWDVATGTLLAELTGPAPGSLGIRLAYNPAGTLLASCGGDGTVRIWDATSHQLRKMISVGPPTGNVNDVTFLPDGRHLATANQNGTVYLLRLGSRY